MDATHPIRDPTRGTLSGEPPPTPRTPRNARRWPRTRATTRRRENFSRLLPPLQRRPAPLDRPGSRDPTINLTHSLSLSLSLSLSPPLSISLYLSPSLFFSLCLPFPLSPWYSMASASSQKPTPLAHDSQPAGHDFRRSLSDVVCSTSCTLFAVFSCSFALPAPELSLLPFRDWFSSIFRPSRLWIGDEKGSGLSVMTGDQFVVEMSVFHFFGI